MKRDPDLVTLILSAQAKARKARRLRSFLLAYESERDKGVALRSALRTALEYVGLGTKEK
ncbi:MAG TPA: hypothetical protein VJ787_04035 [Thermoleophilia bacterium]|nr:hypothetical protein [Thermoleophilia bacterium]